MEIKTKGRDNMKKALIVHISTGPGGPIKKFIKLCGWVRIVEDIR